MTITSKNVAIGTDPTDDFRGPIIDIFLQDYGFKNNENRLGECAPE